MKSEIIGHIDFYDQTEVAVMTENTASSEEELKTELALYCWFALRSLSLVRGEYRDALAQLLNSFGLTKNPNEILAASELNLVKPNSTKGIKGFTIQISLLDQGFTTKNTPYGFGFLGKGTNYYAPMAVIALGCYLLKKHAKDTHFVKELQFSSEKIAEWSKQQSLNVKAEQGLTMAILKDFEEQS